jgi:hypothetical protein
MPLDLAVVFSHAYPTSIDLILIPFITHVGVSRYWRCRFVDGERIQSIAEMETSQVSNLSLPFCGIFDWFVVLFIYSQSVFIYQFEGLKNVRQ